MIRVYDLFKFDHILLFNFKLTPFVRELLILVVKLNVSYASIVVERAENSVEWREKK